MPPLPTLLVLITLGSTAGTYLYTSQQIKHLESELAKSEKKIEAFREAEKRPETAAPDTGGPSAPLTGDPPPATGTTENDTLTSQIEKLQEQLESLRDQNTALADLTEDLQRRLKNTENPPDPNKPPESAFSNTALAERTSALRRLPWAEIPAFGEKSQDEMSTLAEAQFRATWPESYLADRARAYAALGFLDSKDVDFAQVHAGLIAEQTGGIYDPNKTTYYTFAGDNSASDATRANRLLDLAEILIAQHHDLAGAGLYATGNEDSALAARCLYLGDAGLVAGFNSLQERADPSYEPGPPPADRAPFLRAPEHLKQRHIFAYEMGGYFTQSLHEKGGFEKIDAAYKNPPRSSSEILHFNLYENFRPVPIAFDRTEVRGVKPFWDNVVGEAGAQLLLTREVPNSEAQEATFGWQGDRWLVYDGKDDGDQLLWRTLWKDDAQAARFFHAARKFLVERYAIAFKPEYDLPGGAFQVTDPGVRRLHLIHSPGTAEVTLIDASTDTWLEALKATFH